MERSGRKNSRRSNTSSKTGMGSWVKKLYKSNPDGLSDLAYSKGAYLRTFSPFSSQTSLFSSSGVDHFSIASDDDERCTAGMIFDIHQNADGKTINVGRLLQEMSNCGIRSSDPRLSDFMDFVHDERERNKVHSVEALDLPKATFKLFAEKNIVFLSKIFRNDLVIPEFSKFTQVITDIHDHCKKNNDGKVATYIPQLARYDPKLFGVSICTVDGQRFSIGDTDVKFTLQSCSKPFTYGICLNELGPAKVHDYVGHEPSGRNFNEICLDRNLKPHNPMLNSGAIMIASLCMELLKPEMSNAEKFDYVQNYLQRIAGGEDIGFNNAVFMSEKDTADRNYAMAYYMKEHKCFPARFNLQDNMDLYFQFCSMELDTEALSVMGATLANGGICPTTEEKVLDGSCVRDVLSLMYSCGMYNYSGHFAFSVGLPAKSGVSGCLVLVIPNVMSIALFSPPLDSLGNTVRGVQFANEMVELFNFHRFDNLRFSEKKMDPRKKKHENRGMKTMSLLFAANSGDVTALKRHYLQGNDLNQSDYDGRTALHVAAAEGQLECVKFLLSTEDLYANPKDRWGFTPLEEAGRFGHTKIVSYIEAFLEGNINGTLENNHDDNNTIRKT